METIIKKYDLEERLIDFTVLCLDVAEHLPSTRTGNYYSDQLIRSCSVPSLIYGEAKSAESKNDFLHKMKLCLKELRETNICIKIIERKKLSSETEKLSIGKIEVNELISIFVKCIQTASTKKDN